MDYLHIELSKYLNNSSIENINMNHDKIVGIKSNLNIINENKKSVGRVILLKNGSTKLFLDMIVEFNTNKIKWKCVKFDVNNEGFYLIDPYWVKSYSPEPKINVPIKVRIDNQIVIEMRELTESQFQQNKLMEYYYINKTPHIIVAAYRNFYKLNRPGSYYLAINSTVKNYFITQDQLKRIISRINQEKNRIKNEWNKHLKSHLYQNESARLISKLFDKNELEKSKSNVVSFKK